MAKRIQTLSLWDPMQHIAATLMQTVILNLPSIPCSQYMDQLPTTIFMTNEDVLISCINSLTPVLSQAFYMKS
ncbi:hypothetical protein PGTUg99_007233 [Puccinia graminis f. sp. tritici]|uniref:Uncharacterized protein n=1 Tax=Puccinia graminis f. sp. tritici TaxID=56615 RepID=A0A5B0QGM7_PUCGR|nr:hypothetical protein PGTUg99_007233 [Puccinia graminis f. sp. tritici]